MVIRRRTTTIQRSGRHPSEGTRRKHPSRAIPGTGVARILEGNAKSGVPINQKNARASLNLERREMERVARRVTRSTWQRNSRSRRHTSPESRSKQLRRIPHPVLKVTMSDKEGGTELKL
jgi:hypothetical protein